jgi:tetratricopeptide (TPR) repeat protein
MKRAVLIFAMLTVTWAAGCSAPPVPTPTLAPPVATPQPTATPVPPTATLAPPTETAVPPTATPVPPTATPAPPTATAVPPTATPVPPTVTSVPATATATSSAPARQTATALVSDARSLYTNGEYKKAIPVLDQAIALDPTQADAYYYRGLCYANLNQLKPALADLDEAVRLAPTDAYALHVRGNLHDDLGYYDEAISDYTAALNLLVDPSTCKDRGLAYFRRAELDRSLADMNRAILYDSSNTTAFYYRGIIRALKGDKVGAGADLKSALALANSSSRPTIQAELDALSATTYNGLTSGSTSQGADILITVDNGALSSYTLDLDAPGCSIKSPLFVQLPAGTVLIKDGKFASTPINGSAIAGTFGSALRAFGTVTVDCPSGPLTLNWIAKRIGGP